MSSPSESICAALHAAGWAMSPTFTDLGGPRSPSKLLITITRAGKSFTTPYEQGCHCRTRDGSEPTAPTLADVMYALVLDSGLGADTFINFFGDCECSPDSRNALDSYLVCQQTLTNLLRLGANIDELAELFSEY